MEIIEYVLSFLIIVVGLRALWESELHLEARRRAYREGTHDYYGNPRRKKE